MSHKNIYITENDLTRLRELILVARKFGKEDEKYLIDLENELNRGKVIEPHDMPPNIITMNSEIHLKNLNTKEETIYRLVFPDHADVSQGRISILAPIGTALLGYGVGDIIEWKVPAGIAKLKVVKILYQPESAGDYHL